MSKRLYEIKTNKMRILSILFYLCFVPFIYSQEINNIIVDNEQMKCKVSQSESYYIGEKEYKSTTIEYCAQELDFYIIITPIIRFYPDKYAEIRQKGETLNILDMLYNTDEYAFNIKYPKSPNLLSLLWKGIRKGQVFKLTVLHEASLTTELILAPLRPHKGIGPISKLSKCFEYNGVELTIFLPANFEDFSE